MRQLLTKVLSKQQYYMRAGAVRLLILKYEMFPDNQHVSLTKKVKLYLMSMYVTSICFTK